jgi:hypothetical protein
MAMFWGECAAESGFQKPDLFEALLEIYPLLKES